MSLSQISVLSAETAISFREEDIPHYKPAEKTTVVFVAVDERNLPNTVDSDHFEYQNLIFKIVRSDEHNKKWICLHVLPKHPAEWSLLVQLRIKTGENSQILNVVDKDVFKFDSFSLDVNVEIQTDDVKYLKFEMRILNLLYLEHPKLIDGDEVIEFDDGSKIKVHAHVLGLLSNYMAQCEKQASKREGGALIKVTSTEKSAFVELVNQAYPTRRPINASFRQLSAVAVGYKCEALVYHLSKHLIEYNNKPMTFIQRFQAAIENRLEPAVRELAFRSAQDGTWDRMIQSGFEAENFCGHDVYTKLVCPAILAGRGAKIDSTTLINPTKKVNFLEKETDDESKATILFRGTYFYINKGLLACHGKDLFCVGQNGEYIARYTAEFQRECARENLLPGEVFLQLLGYMLPFGEVPNPNMIRACIVLCHDHGWNILKENLEQEIEPPISTDHYMSQLVFAEKFHLDNLMRTNIQRAESSCRESAELLEKEGVLRKLLSDKTREALMDRMCSGWGLNPKVNRLATRVPTSHNHRVVSLKRGMALVVGEGRAIDTLHSIESEYAFGAPNELVLVE